MLVLLCGPNTYARERKIREIVDIKRAAYSDAPYLSLSGDDENALYRLESFVFESGLFAAGKRIAVVRDFDSLCEQDAAVWTRMCLRARQDDVLLILSQYITTKDQRRISLWVGGNHHHMYFFDMYRDADAIQILLDEAKRISCILDRAAAIKIYTRAQKDMYGSLEELRKLSLMRQPITTSLLASFYEYGESMALYDFARAVVYNADISKKLTLWEYMLLQKVDGYMLFGYLAKMARDKKLIDALARADEMVKSGRLDIQQALEEIVINTNV